MTTKQIENKQKKITKALRLSVHPDNPLSHHMTMLYRELEQQKQLQNG